MNIKKINNEGLKQMFKAEEGKERPITGYIVEDAIYITFKGVELFKMKLTDYHLNMNDKKTFSENAYLKEVVDELEGRYYSQSEFEQVEKIELIGKVRDIKNTIKLQGKTKKVYINQDLLKYFNKDCKILIWDELKPVVIIEDDFIVGAVFPIRYEEN